MKSSSTARAKKESCSHRYIDQRSSQCLHCGQFQPSTDAPTSVPVLDDRPDLVEQHEDNSSLELEHYERLVSILDAWKTTMINRIESIYKSKKQHLRDGFERQQAQRRRIDALQKKHNDNNEQVKEDVDLTVTHFKLLHSASIDTEYSLVATSYDTIFIHDGRTMKLFDKNLRPLVAIDLAHSIRERCKVVDLCYVAYLSAYLILYEQALWIFEPGSNANLIPAIKRRSYLSLTTNSKDLFLLDGEGMIEQRSLISWTYLRRYSKQHLLNDFINEQLLTIRFHAVESTTLMAIVRTTNNRRCLMIYQHYGCNAFKLLDRILFPSVNVYSISSLRISHVWVIATCEKQAFFFLDHQRQNNQREQQQRFLLLDCDYRIKNVLEFSADPRSIIVRTIKPSQVRLYQFWARLLFLYISSSLQVQIVFRI